MDIEWLDAVGKFLHLLHKIYIAIALECCYNEQHMESAVKHEIRIVQYEDNALSITIDCPDTIVAFGLIAYGQYAVFARTEEVAKINAKKDRD
jgi:hypothetical protein